MLSYMQYHNMVQTEVIMLKKFGIGLLLAILLVSVIATTVFADDDRPPLPPAWGWDNPRRAAMGYNSEVVAEFLGMSLEELRAAHEAGKTIQDLLLEKDISEEDFRQAMLEDLKERLDSAVADGKLTQEQADRMLENMENRPLDGFGMPRPPVGNWDDRPFFGDFDRDYQRGGFLSDLLGMTLDEIRQALKDGGKTIRDLFTEKGLTQDEVDSAMKSAMQERLQKAVEDGNLTQEQADTILDKAGQGRNFRFPGMHPNRGGRFKQPFPPPAQE